MLNQFLNNQFVLLINDKNYDLELIDRLKHLGPEEIIDKARKSYGNQACIRFDGTFRYANKSYYDSIHKKVVPIAEFLDAITKSYDITENDLDSMFEE